MTWEGKKETIERWENPLEKARGLTRKSFLEQLAKTQKSENELIPDSTYDFRFFIHEENMVDYEKISLMKNIFNLSENSYHNSQKVFDLEYLNSSLKYAKQNWENLAGISFANLSENVNDFEFKDENSLVEFYDLCTFNGEVSDINDSDAVGAYSLLKLLKSRISVLAKLPGNKEDQKKFHGKIKDFTDSENITIYGTAQSQGQGFVELVHDDLAEVYKATGSVNQSYIEIYHRAKKVNSAHAKAIAKEERGMEATKDMHGLKIECKSADLENVFLTVWNNIQNKFSDKDKYKIEILELKNKNWASGAFVDKINTTFSGDGIKIEKNKNSKSDASFKSFSIIFRVYDYSKERYDDVEIQYNPLQSELPDFAKSQYYKFKLKFILISKIHGPAISEKEVDRQINIFIENNLKNSWGIEKTFIEIKEELLGKTEYNADGIIENRKGSTLVRVPGKEYLFLRSKLDLMSHDEYAEYIDSSLL